MPVLEALLFSGASWVVAQSAAGIAGNTADRVFTAALRGIRERITGLSGTPEGADLIRGLRRAQFRALERVVRDYHEVGRHVWLHELNPRPHPFFERALAFCRDTGGRAAALPPNHAAEAGSAGGGLLALMPGTEGAGESISADGNFVEDAVLGELRAALDDVEPPQGFEDHYRQGGRGRPRFLDLFGLYFTEQIKEDARFREVVNVTLLLQNAAGTIAVGELVARLEQRFGHALLRVERGVAEGNERLEKIASKQDSLSAALAALAEHVSEQKGVPVAPLRAILTRLGEEEVPDDQIAARLAAKADEYVALREQWANAGASAPDVEAVRRQALTLIDRGDLDGARRLFVEARNTIRASREERSRQEAALLADEADIDHLEFRYRAAVERYAEAEALVRSFDPRARFHYLCRQASSLQQLGDELGDNAALAGAADLWSHAANLAPRSEVPFEWAMTQNNRGNALQALGRRQSGTERLKQAVDLYRVVLEEYTRERMPLHWAAIQNNLGNALLALGTRERGTARLEQAVNAYQAALEERTRERVPLGWATIQNNLGNAFLALGKRESGTERLQLAVDAYCAALEERTRERVPLDWAMTQHNLANALLALGLRESGTERLEQAVNALRAVLEERTRGRVPLDWAAAQDDLGNVLYVLGKRGSGTQQLQQAVDAHRAALEERTRERVPFNWAATQNNLGNSLRALGERESGTERLEQAVDAYRAALEEYTRERVPLHWAKTQNNLGNALRALGERESGSERLEEAVKTYRAALEERTRELVPLDWATTQHSLGNALRVLGQREEGTERLEQAVDAYRAALEVLEQAVTEYDLDVVRVSLANAQALLERRRAGM
jgi:tetratricopeptide (TPR) repeat protein